ncbi:hypothetical protein GALMADRAFT_1077821 [Galerina marginata CBS 339.88]|uniref:Uncharacterized protein n=1 Tax=Galerina marginata (strain CBS 339.88) TaxID=685588 RepID=A0A067S9J5_GALM3|nr:hypothetical protein GALMADRAFT_1077821 [Galerina marginata CBS 339.88]
MGNTDFVDLLTYLEQSRSITQEEYNRRKSEIVTNDGLKLSGLLALFADVNWAGGFLLSLPLSLNGTPDSAVSGFTNLIASEFSSSHVEALDGWKGIESISFKVGPPQGSTFTWIFPFGKSSPSRSRSYQLTHDGVIDISVEWPAYSERSVQGSYRGILHVGVDKYPIVGKFLMASDAAPLYSMTFANESYDVDSYRVPISVPLSLFDATDFSISEQLQQMDIGSQAR